MNNGFTPERYAAIVNLYGSRLRAIAPNARIVACGRCDGVADQTHGAWFAMRPPDEPVFRFL